jgi:hypothetical protein
MLLIDIATLMPYVVKMLWLGPSWYRRFLGRSIHRLLVKYIRDTVPWSQITAQVSAVIEQ